MSADAATPAAPVRLSTGTDAAGWQMRWVDGFFPFTRPSLELEVYYQDRWMELLGSGIVQQRIASESGPGGDARSAPWPARTRATCAHSVRSPWSAAAPRQQVSPATLAGPLASAWNA